MNIFDIQKRIDEILETAELNEGDLGESGFEELAIAEQDLQDKVYAYSFIIDRYKSDIATIKSYKQALDDRIKRFDKRIEKLKTILCEVVRKYGEPVTKKNKETGEYEPTGSYSLKYPNISLNVRDGVEVISYDDMVNVEVDKLKDNIVYGICDDEEHLNRISSFFDIKLTTAMTMIEAIKLKEFLKTIGIVVDSDTFTCSVNKTHLKKTLMQDPEGIDAWELQSKDVVTIRK